MSKSKPRTVPLLGELSNKMAALRKIERAIDGMSPVDAASVLWDAYSAAAKQSSTPIVAGRPMPAPEGVQPPKAE